MLLLNARHVKVRIIENKNQIYFLYTYIVLIKIMIMISYNTKTSIFPTVHGRNPKQPPGMKKISVVKNGR